jgi:hypothetical protein
MRAPVHELACACVCKKRAFMRRIRANLWRSRPAPSPLARPLRAGVDSEARRPQGVVVQAEVVRESHEAHVEPVIAHLREHLDHGPAGEYHDGSQRVGALNHGRGEEGHLLAKSAVALLPYHAALSPQAQGGLHHLGVVGKGQGLRPLQAACLNDAPESEEISLN